MELTFKPVLAATKPYPTTNDQEYLKFLSDRKKDLSDGNIAVYLAHKIIKDGKELFRPFLDIDGNPNLKGDEKIESANQNLLMTYKILEKLGVVHLFKFIATGNSGFRTISNILFNEAAHNAFRDLVKLDMPHIWDRQPTSDTETPYQLFAYKGNQKQNKKQLVDRHSVYIPNSQIKAEILTVEYYISITGGKLDPDKTIEFVKWLFDGTPIVDLKILGHFGETLEQYQQRSKELKLYPFSFNLLRKETTPIELEVMQEMLAEKGIISAIEQRGNNLALSFPLCPACGKKSGNAVAYPPFYRFTCFRTNCQASDGLPLRQWAGIKAPGNDNYKRKKSFGLRPPSSFIDLREARQKMRDELKNGDNSLIVVTPGVGKTHSAMQVIGEMAKDKIIIYSSFNKDLQLEAFNLAKKLSGDKSSLHLLQSREDCCKRRDELRNFTEKGFSPAELLCPNCEYRNSDCPYYRQRANFGKGVYFVTHHMLRYLEDRIPSPDLIILDENIKSGFLLEDTCSRLQFQSLLRIGDEKDSMLVKNIVALADQIWQEVLERNLPDLIINGRKSTKADIVESTIIEILAKRMNKSEDDLIKDIESIVTKVYKRRKSELFSQEINMKAVNWLKGLYVSNIFSYLNISKNGEVQFRSKQLTPLGYTSTPIKILDATGDPNSAYPLIRRGPNVWDKDQELKVVRLDVPWNSHRVHIQMSTSRYVMRRMKDIDLKRHLGDMLSHTKAKKVMLITYKFLEDKAIKILKDIAPDREFMGYHFFGPRGVNDYKDCDAALVLGLPYANLNSAAQDACILFPNEQDEDLRFDWPEATMQWELIQNIHRIRPVNKEERIVDIVIAARSWPSVFPKPDLVIDRSQSKSWKEIAIQRLEPFVETFGFLNQDIGFLAGVYVKKKGPIAEEYRRKIFKPLNLYDEIKLTKNVDSNPSTCSFWEEDIISGCNSGLTDIQDNFDEIEQLDKLRRKWIFLIKNIYSKNLLREDNITIINQLRILFTENYPTTQEDIFTLPNNNQWAELKIYFKDKHPHFEDFKIKLPQARNNFVHGVGDKDRVKDFYRKINSLRIYKKVDVNTYTVTNSASNKLDPIPEGFVSIYIPEPNGDPVYLGYNDRFKTISLTLTSAKLTTVLKTIANDQDTTIVTNDGKFVAMALLESGLPKFEIIDVVLNQKMISNGECEVKFLNLNFTLKQYDLPTGLEIRTIIRRLYDFWTKQKELIYQFDLQEVFELEKSLIWVTAKIERNGFPINTDKMLEYGIKAEEIFNKLETELRRVFPSKISLLYDEKIIAYLNRTFRLKLCKISEPALKAIKEQRVKDIMQKLIEYRKLKMDLDQIKRIAIYTGKDNRVRDSIEQISTKTGRLYRPLQSVKKDGSIRSFFQAKAGYKFIVADYSQQEARIMADLAEDKSALEIFRDGKDLYLEVAKIIKNGTEEDHRNFRNRAKIIFLGQINGMTTWGTYLQLEKDGWYTDIDHIAHLLSNLFDEFDGIAKWQMGIVEKAKNEKFVASKLGRRRKVDDDVRDNSIVNFPIQATASDGFKLALLDLDQKLEGLDARIVHIIHDEIIVEAREDIVDEVSKMVKECMEKAYEKMLPTCPFLVEPKITDTWG